MTRPPFTRARAAHEPAGHCHQVPGRPRRRLGAPVQTARSPAAQVQTRDGDEDQQPRRPRDAVASLGPNWFASVMGTGIVATAAATLPVQSPGLRGFATVIWGLAAAWLVVLTAGTIMQWAWYRPAALTVGAGAFRWAAAGGYLILVAAWAVVSVRTAAAIGRGSLLRAAAPVVPADEPLLPAGEPLLPAGEPLLPAHEVAELTLTGDGIGGGPA